MQNKDDEILRHLLTLKKGETVAETQETEKAANLFAKYTKTTKETEQGLDPKEIEKLRSKFRETEHTDGKPQD